MSPELLRAVERGLGQSIRFTAPSVGGSSFDTTRTLRLDDGRDAFLKANETPRPGAFLAEAHGLEALERAGALRVPKVLAVAERFLVLEWIELGMASAGFWERFGQDFAKLHLRTAGGRPGFSRDNYLGATPQPNATDEDWCEFWRLQRLGHQLETASASGLLDPELARLGQRLMDRLDEWLGEIVDPMSLLHGDLWSGNVLCDSHGAPVLIDPAAYHGHREADLAMTQLFGGFSEPFYSAYEEVWPLEPGWRERLEIYKLYHLLNHLNLFGASYRGGCVDILRRLVG